MQTALWTLLTPAARRPGESGVEAFRRKRRAGKALRLELRYPSWREFWLRCFVRWMGAVSRCPQNCP
eukprot:652381-Prorocentrum_lima.AAC.1